MAAKKKTTTAKKKTTAKVVARRADYGAPVEAFFAKQPPALRPVVDALRALVREAAPQAESSLKWGMPFYTLNGEMLCAIGGHKAHVNLILPGPPGTYTDPDGRLEGEGKTGKHLRVTTVADVPKANVRAWLRTAVARAKAGA